MDKEERKPAQLSVEVPAQQSRDQEMYSAEDTTTQTPATRPANEESRAAGHDTAERDALAQTSTPDVASGSGAAHCSSNRVGRDDNNINNNPDSNGKSMKEAPPSPLPKPTSTFVESNVHRAPKRKKDFHPGSSQLTHTCISLYQTQNPSTPSSQQQQCASQVPSSRISDNSQSGDLVDKSQIVLPADPAARRAQVRAWGNQPLAVVDSTVWDIMEHEKLRQWRGIELIASENFASQAVIEALGSHLTNKYSEGLPGSRYYGGNEYIDMIESLCISRALAAFHLDPKDWGVNVQPYSCTSANFAVYTALLQPKDRIMGLDVPSGGHVSHGYYTASGKKVSGASIFFESLPFKVNPQTGLIDFESLEKFALNYRPKILICGGSAYPREWDYARFRAIANKIGAILLCDMAHISGLIAAQEAANPFDYCDVVTTTTHKSLRGPRGGMIFYRKGLRVKRSSGPDTLFDFEDRINFAVHPSLQGGPHNNHIAALAVALKQVATPEYKQYIQQVKSNAQALAKALIKRGCVLVTGGTDNHLFLWDLRNRGLTGNRLEKVCEICHMTLNKNAVFGDSTALGVGGVRIGTPAMTSRGCIEEDFEVIADFLMEAVQITESIQTEHGKLQKDFVKGLQNNKDILELRNKVEKFASMFEMPGFDVTSKGFSQ
ncbi:unnamed protein product [Calypogeia fissa]